MEHLRYLIYRVLSNILEFLYWIFIALICSSVSSSLLILLLLPYVRINLKDMTFIAKINIIHKGFVMITTYLFLILIVIYMIYFLYQLSHAEYIDHFEHTHFHNDAKQFLSKIIIYWIEIYSIVVGFVDSNLPAIYKGQSFALSISTYIVLIIPSIAFTSLVAMTQSHIQQQI